MEILYSKQGYCGGKIITCFFVLENGVIHSFTSFGDYPEYPLDVRLT